MFTSNIFAILGLRALYFALAAMIDRFAYLKYALATVLIFIGSKIVVADMLGIAKVPPPCLWARPSRSWAPASPTRCGKTRGEAKLETKAAE